MTHQRCNVDLERLFDVNALVSVYYKEHDFITNELVPSEKYCVLDCWQIHCLAKGMKDLRIGNTTHTLCEGSVAFISPGTYRYLPHTTVRNDHIICSFICDSPYMHAFENSIIALTEAELDMLKKIVYLGTQNTVRIREQERSGFVPRDNVPKEMLSVFKVYLELFLTLLYNRIQNNVQTSNLLDSELEGRQSVLVSGIKDYFLAHLHENITLEDLSVHFFLSPTYIKRVFKQVTGYSVMQYFLELKISEAKRLIRENKMSIHEIAAALSYSSPTYFSNAFKRCTGKTPSEYKKAYLIERSQSYRTMPFQ